MPTIVPNMPLPNEFQRTSTGANVKHRGKYLKKIDKALEVWSTYARPDHQHRIHLLGSILTNCKRWQTKKAGKESDNCQLRRLAVEDLAKKAFTRMQFEICQDRKVHRGRLAGMPLQAPVGSFAHERTTYEDSGKTSAISGTTAVAIIRSAANSPQATAFLAGRSFDQLDAVDFERLVREFAPDPNLMFDEIEVQFLRKRGRIEKLIVMENGTLFDGPDHRFDTGEDASLETGGFPYAIDNYGNLLSCAEPPPANPRFNHSTFNAGKSVVCAGMITVRGGKVFRIDNNSGHYKPSATQLRNALRILQECGVKLSEMQVAVKEPNPARPGRCLLKVYLNAANYLANPLARPSEQHDVA